MPLSRWKPGDGPTAGRLNETVRAINSARLSGPMAGRRRPAGRPISSQDPRPLWAKLAGASSPYTFVEQIETDAAGTWADGPATGTAYEVNNVAGLADEVHRIHPDGFGKYRFQSLKYSNGCPVTLTLTAKCGDSGSSPTNLSGALVELLDSAGTTVLASGTGSLTYAADGTKAYQSRVTLSGYHTKTYPLGVLGCTTPRAVSVYTWPTTMTVTVRTYIQGGGFTPPNCDLPGATVTFSGHMTGSAVSNGSGIASLTMSTSSGAHRQFCTATITAPSGYGTQNRASFTIEYPARPGTGLWPCSDTATIQARVFNRADHTSAVFSGRFMPINWSYSDDYGTGSIAITIGNQGIGTYTYASSECSLEASCTPMTAERQLPHQPGNPKISFALYLTGESCGNGTFEFNRGQHLDILLECSPSTAKAAALGLGGSIPALDPANVQTLTTAVGSTITLNFTMPQTYTSEFTAPTVFYPVPESVVSATFTATVL